MNLKSLNKTHNEEIGKLSVVDKYSADKLNFLHYLFLASRNIGKNKQVKHTTRNKYQCC